jgi:tRNA(Ile)-lysidine synthase
MADVRRAVREALEGVAPGGAQDGEAPGALVLVALSGGPDSLALAAATAFEALRAGLRAGAVIVDHGLQAGSAEVAERAAAQARELGLDPVLVRRVDVGSDGGPEAAARDARYAALAEAASETGASAVLLGHTLDDQAETVLLGLARGSGATSLSGMAAVTATAAATVTEATASEAAGGGAAVTYVRPLLGIRRETTRQFCADSGLEPWHDPQNGDSAFARVRVRERVLPVLESELGPGIAEALARTAEQAREDAEALDHFAAEQVEELADHAEAGLSLTVKGLAHNPAALRQRIIRLAVSAEFGVSLSRAQTLAVARLVTEWRGQGEVHLPGVRVVRQGGLIVFSAAEGDVQARG